MKILFLTERAPYPLDSGGRIRSFHTLKSLSEKHEVTLTAGVEKTAYDETLSVFGRLCSSTSLVPYNKKKANLQLLKRVWRGVPASLARHYNPSLASVLIDLFSRQTFDAVHYDHLDSSIYSHLVPPELPTTLDEHNIVTQQLLTTSRSHPNALVRLLMRLEAIRVGQYEKRVCANQAFCLVCSDADRRYLQELSPSARVLEIPNGVDLGFFHKEASGGTQRAQDVSLLFVGTLDYLPCDIAVQHFIKNILPIIQKTHPSCRFYAVGSNPSEEVRRLGSLNRNVIITGRVPDVRPYLASSQVCVVPILSGSGTRLKILEAMAMQLPVVSTHIGAEGLKVRNGEHILLADHAEAFAQAVIHLLDDAQLAQRIRQNALKLVQEHYGWQTISEALSTVYSTLSSDIDRTSKAVVLH